MQHTLRSNLGHRSGAALACAALLAACSTQRPAPALCTLEDGQLHVYDALGSGVSAPRASYGDRVDLGNRMPWEYAWDRRGGLGLFFAGDDLLVPAGGALKAFPRRAEGNAAPRLSLRADWLGKEALRSSSGELVAMPDGAEAYQSLRAYSAAALAGQRNPAPEWTLDFGTRRVVSGALDEARDQLLLVLGTNLYPFADDGADANGIHSKTALRGYRRGQSDPAAFLWEIDFSGSGLSLGPVAVDAQAGLLYAIAWAPATVAGQWNQAELLVFTLGGAAPVQRARVPLEGPALGLFCDVCGVPVSARHVALSGTALQVARSGELLLGMDGGRVLSFGVDGQASWLLETTLVEPDSHLVAFAVDAAGGELAVLREHFSYQWPVAEGSARRSIAFYSYGNGPPSLLRVIDGAASQAALPGGLAADAQTGEVVLTATAPAALTTFAVDAPDGAPAVRSTPALSVGALQSWTVARDGRGHLWTLANGRVLVFDEGPGASALPQVVDVAGESLLFDTSRGELWLTSTLADSTLATNVYAVDGTKLTRSRTFAGQSPEALDEARGEVWTSPPYNGTDAGRLTLSVYPVVSAAGAPPRLTIPLRGVLGSGATVDARRGELYVQVDLPTATGAAPIGVVEVYDVVTGKLLRTLEGIAPVAMAICR